MDKKTKELLKRWKEEDIEIGDIIGWQNPNVLRRLNKRIDKHFNKLVKEIWG